MIALNGNKEHLLTGFFAWSEKIWKCDSFSNIQLYFLTLPQKISQLNLTGWLKAWESFFQNQLKDHHHLWRFKSYKHVIDVCYNIFTYHGWIHLHHKAQSPKEVQAKSSGNKIYLSLYLIPYFVQGHNSRFLVSSEAQSLRRFITGWESIWFFCFNPASKVAWRCCQGQTQIHTL